MIPERGDGLRGWTPCTRIVLWAAVLAFVAVVVLAAPEPTTPTTDPSTEIPWESLRVGTLWLLALVGSILGVLNFFEGRRNAATLRRIGAAIGARGEKTHWDDRRVADPGPARVRGGPGGAQAPRARGRRDALPGGGLPRPGTRRGTPERCRARRGAADRGGACALVPVRGAHPTSES